MKKILCAILALVMLVSLCACQKDVEDMAAQPQGPVTDVYLRDIQGAYDAEMAKEENQNTVTMVQLTQDYAEKWKTVAEEYCAKIMAFDGALTPNPRFNQVEAMKSYISATKADFESSFQRRSDDYLQSLQDVHGGGSIMGLSMAVFEYGLCKDFALEILRVYDSCCVKEG